MANRKISDLTALTAPASGDFVPIVDISEAAAADKNKRITFQNLQRYYDSDSSHYVAFGAPASVTTSLTWTLPAADGTNGQVLSTNGSGILSWGAGGGGTPGGSDTQIQFNDGGAFGGDVDLTWDKTNNVLTVGGDVTLNDGGTYTTTVQTVTATANRTISFPDATGTVALVAGSSGQLLYNNAGALAGGPQYDGTKGTLGYSAGGAVTQATNKSTGVTLAGASGRITMNAAALTADTTVSFTLTNTSVTANDLLILNHVSGGTAGSYLLNAQAAAGTASINVRNITAGSLSEAIVIGFAVIKA